METWGGRLRRLVLAVLAYGAVAAVVCLPIAAEQSVEDARFQDRLGTLPVEVSLARNGVSTLDTGVLGRLYWERTGVGGFGASLRATGPPEAGGTLTSYVTPKFLRANTELVNDPGEVARIYGGELRNAVLHHLLWYTLLAALVGGLVLTAVSRGRPPPMPPWADTTRRQVGLVAVGLVVCLALSTLIARQLFIGWAGSDEIGTTYAMPGVDRLSFSSPQAREVAQQIQPFVEKNTTRIDEQAAAYEDTAKASLDTTIPAHADGLRPRSDERVVLAEADPQGSLVATKVRTALYPLLQETLGEDAIALRTISGDVSSNGAVAEKGFIALESAASPGIPVVAVKGDHDSDTTVDQLRDDDVQVPDLETVDAGDLAVSGAADPAFKTLFGGLVTNDSGTSEEDIGKALRKAVDPDLAGIVLLHQPRAVDGYLGIDGRSDLDATAGHLTTPWDDGIPDVPPGSVNYGHLHDPDGPWVLWNTDGDEVTWTVVSQLGTAGGVLETPTFNRFSTPFSTPLKPITVQLQYVNTKSGLQTGYASIQISTDGTVTVQDRISLGLPGGQPAPRDSLRLSAG
ncbi:hypothetical protein ABLE68_18345 [Nocardioides sp. CN2-186]|uniref:hypothetical protein n=1 Tax=Nocardioides tweenelious TaxID=3156607 RepID=UPI0032B61D67